MNQNLDVYMFYILIYPCAYNKGTFSFLCYVPLAFPQLLQEGLHISSAWTSLHHCRHLCYHDDLKI